MTLQLRRYRDLLTRKYSLSETMGGLLDEIQEVGQTEIVDAVCDTKAEATLNASGFWLDLLAARFEVDRPLKADGTSSYFGFNGVPQAKTFLQAPFRRSGSSSGLVPISDAVFRSFLQSTLGRLRTDGTQNNINQIIWEAYPGSFVVDNDDMSMTFYLNISGLDEELQIVAQKDGNVPKPCGVEIDETVLVVPFGFDGAGEVFDNAAFVIEMEGPTLLDVFGFDGAGGVFDEKPMAN